jgi:lysine 2,3-aminomutase
LLRNINDNWLVLSELLSILDELNIRNLSIFIPDPIIYSGAYRIDFKRVIKIIDDLNFNASSWVNSTRFILDTVYGKVRRENIESFDNENQTIIFNRN